MVVYDLHDILTNSHPQAVIMYQERDGSLRHVYVPYMDEKIVVLRDADCYASAAIRNLMPRQ